MSLSWTIETRSDAGAFEELADWWNRCPGPAASPFLRSEWFSLWSDAFLSERSRLELISWKRDGEVKAVLPTSSTGLRRASLSNSHSDVFDLITDGTAETSGVVGEWLGRRPMTRLYRLDGLSSLQPEQPDGSWQVVEAPRSPYASLGSGLEGLREGMGRNLKKNIGRLERRLDDLGEVTYLDNADGELPGAVELGMELEAAGWKGEQGSAMLSSPESERFYRRLFELARARGWLRLSTLLVSERMVACQFSLDYGGRRFLLKPAYDEDWASHSPGKVLQWKVMQAAIAGGLESYEFCGDAERWKTEWTKDARPRTTVLRFANGGPQRLVAKPLQWFASRRRGQPGDEEESTE